MNIILTSNPAFSIEVDENRKAIKLENTDLVEQIKSLTERYNDLLFVCSNQDDYKNTEAYAKIIEKSLSLSKIKFSKSDILDNRNALFTKSLINNSDLIILLGGNPLEQIEFLKEIDFKNKLKGFKGCLMGISAGSINMAKEVYCSKDDEIEESIRYKGLGLLDFSLEPHFDIADEKRIKKILLKDSIIKPFLALPDESFITIKDDKITLFGDAYYFKNEEYKLINNIEEILEKKEPKANVTTDAQENKKIRRSTIKIVDVMAVVAKIKREAMEKNKDKPVLGRREINKLIKQLESKIRRKEK